MDKRVISLIIGTMALIVVALGVLVWLQFRDPATPQYDPQAQQGGGGPAIDSGARIEIEKLRREIEALNEQIKSLERRMEQSRARPTETAPVEGQTNPNQIVRDGPNQILDAYAKVVLIANRRAINDGVRIASPSYLESVFGRPRDNLTSSCEAMTNERLRSKLVLEQVGPIRVRLQKPAIESLRRVFAQIKAMDPDLYERINTAGSLCVRHIRGAPMRTSTHAFGLSVDLNIDGKLDTLGDGKTQLGLTILADFFRTEGWYWGAGFSREDSMHFEASRDLVEKWVAEGLL